MAMKGQQTCIKSNIFIKNINTVCIEKLREWKQQREKAKRFITPF